ncbi:MAG: ATP-binding cassette, subfamily bacterial [Clostridiales bacterium]|nr:ATP-binding cassette, subfamily bacterial [Clostridiales bacterium]MDN5297776.1 ATP-binding cassette, subfamily bacterial [Clostridiales bacterium]
MKNIIKFMDGYKFMFITAILAIVIATLMQLATPIIIKYAVDTVIGHEDPGNLAFFQRWFGATISGVVLAFIITNLIRGIFLFVKGYFSNVAAEAIAKRMRDALYEHIQYMPFAYHTGRETGDLIQRCTSDVETVRRFLGVQVADLGRIIFMVVLSVAVMFSLSAKLTLYAVVLVPVLFLFSYLFFIKVQQNFTKSDEAEGRLTTVLQENLSGVRVVRAFGRERYEIDKFETVNREYRDTTFKLIELLGVFWSSSEIIALIQSGIVLIVGSQMVMRDEVTLGTLIAFITYESMLLLPVKQSGRLLSELGKMTVASKRIEEVLSEPVEEEEKDALKPAIKGDIRFENVSFAYEDGKDVLKGLNFEVKAGQTLGILGATGSGKSTLVQLLQRLYDYSGEIYIDDTPLSKIDRHWIRKHIGLVIQEPYLYAKNVKENIGITDPSYSFDAIRNAAERAAIHESIEGFKDGYETVIGEKGVSLSGGQKQRIAISRTIIDDAKPILVFDDSLSAVDTETDQKIRQALAARKTAATTIMISHRLTTLAKADVIIVLDEGEILQMGTHEALIAEDGMYKHIWELQRAIA